MEIQVESHEITSPQLPFVCMNVVSLCQNVASMTWKIYD